MAYTALNSDEFNPMGATMPVNVIGNTKEYTPDRAFLQAKQQWSIFNIKGAMPQGKCLFDRYLETEVARKGTRVSATTSNPASYSRYVSDEKAKENFNINRVINVKSVVKPLGSSQIQDIGIVKSAVEVDESKLDDVVDKIPDLRASGKGTSMPEVRQDIQDRLSVSEKVADGLLSENGVASIIKETVDGKPAQVSEAQEAFKDGFESSSDTTKNAVKQRLAKELTGDKGYIGIGKAGKVVIKASMISKLNGLISSGQPPKALIDEFERQINDKLMDMDMEHRVAVIVAEEIGEELKTRFKTIFKQVVKTIKPLFASLKAMPVSKRKRKIKELLESALGGSSGQAKTPSMLKGVGRGGSLMRAKGGRGVRYSGKFQVPQISQSGAGASAARAGGAVKTEA